MTISSTPGIFAMQPKSEPHDDGTSRRTFLKLSGGAGVGLVLGMAASVPSLGFDQASAAGAPLAPNPFLIVAPDNTVTVIIKHLDKGQGAATGLATLVAEELDADRAQIRTVFAPSDAVKYANSAFGVQGVGGSTGLANSYLQYRGAGAAARAMIVAAAAKKWGVNVSEITVAKGVVSHGSGKTATLGELAELASAETIPATPKLKDPKDFVYIGKAFPRVDSADKTIGRTKYTIDHQFPGMLIAMVARPPKFGATFNSVDKSAAEKVPGVVNIIEIPRGLVVVAKSTWAAMKGRDALNITWDDTQADQRGSKDLVEEYTALVGKDGFSVRNDGNVADAFKSAVKIVEANFEFPYLAHAPLEPMDCIVQFDGTSAEIWTGSQLQTVDHGVAAGVLNIKPEAIQLHTVWAGGSFGRRAVPDSHYVAEACEIVKALKTTAPVKLMWTREDDIKGGYYRPLYVHYLKAGIDKDGKIVAWQHRIAGQSIMTGTPFESMMKGGFDKTSVEGADTLPYEIPNLKVELHTTKSKVPVLWWRSVGSTHTAHATEHMIDILAREAGKDPVAYRLDMLKDKPRHAGALKLAAEKADWGSPLPVGRYRGVAVHESFSSFVAQVAEVSFKDDGTFKVERVVCAIDCGVAVNPDVIAAQMEGGIGYGLGAALKGAITLAGGKVKQSNFDDYDVLRMSEMPKVEVHIVPSTEKPSGVGEPGTPLIMPAVANALLSGTGVRTTILPMSNQKYRGQA